MKFVVGREDCSSSPSMADNTESLMKKKKMTKALKEQEEAAADRISGLPEPIIHHIMSLLPVPEITRMSTLSKTFFSIWRSYPILVFDYAFFANLRSVKKTGRRQIKWFLDSIHESLQNRSSELMNNNEGYDLQRLKFWGPIDYGFRFDTTFDEMLDFALMNNVKELSLNVEAKYCDYRRNKRKPYRFGVDHAIFNAVSKISVLKLTGFELEQRNDDYDDDDDGDNIVLNFPLLEKFTLKKCCGFTSITLSGEKLRAVKLDSCKGLKKIHIDAPKSLESFSFAGVGDDKCEISISCCEILKFLELKSENSVDEFRVGSNIYRFRCLEELVIWRGCFLKNISPLYFDCLRCLEADGCDFEAEFKIGVGFVYLNGVVVD